MDKNTVIGFSLIALIVVGFMWFNKPSQEQMENQKRHNDSIALVQQQQQAAQAKTDSLKTFTPIATAADTAKTAINSDSFGSFGISASGEEKFTVIENEYLKLTVSNKGGRIYAANLKKYRTHDSLPLILFDKDDASFNFVLSTNSVNGRVVNTSDLYFEPVGNVVKDIKGNQTLTMRLKTSVANAYIDFIYTLPAKNYMLYYDIKATGMENVMPTNINSLELQWNEKLRQQEKGRKFEAQYSNIYYKFLSNDVEKMSNSKDDNKKVDEKLKWVAFKDQFFSSILIANNDFVSGSLTSHVEKDEKSHFLKYYSATLNVPFDPTGKNVTGFKWYFGPNQYKILSSYDKGVKSEEKLQLRSIVPLGWGIFGLINRYLIIPMFNFFSQFLSNFGIIILLLTIVIKMLLFPLTYKSYMSSAKMRVLKPEIDEINARIPADKPMDRQKATMELYNKVGVSPMSGCLPAALQMPILFALFSFFPAAIELRQQSFLWAQDLSSYDSIWNFGTNIPLLGNHLSLFTLLMTVANILSTKLMSNTQPTADQPGAEMMKWMMYLMPVMFLFMFNDYASGLSYYYFISAVITIIQMYAIRAMVDDKKILAELHAKRNSKEPKKKSGFMERLEKMQREQQKALQQKNKKK